MHRLRLARVGLSDPLLLSAVGMSLAGLACLRVRGGADQIGILKFYIPILLVICGVSALWSP